ncbi:hypothetical protein [Arundinibacter roseus]|uniref:Uncharacterized protein n=1 Tax=Arundinibacter roseus TaxID=2070510 RepID=A0A4R4KFY6_9BACT|nr:hypothetical protein [Arundinibacter roseus]TDB66937.1 hypothetical protein EZE20_07390 [Arundinibacter roseus]
MKDNYFQLGQLETEFIHKSKGLKIKISEDYWYSSDIEVFAFPIPIEKTSGNSINYLGKKGDINILFCPFKPKTWKNIYAIRVSPSKKNDELGYIEKFSRILKNHNINILKLQSNPTFPGEPYSFWLLTDISNWDKTVSIDSELEKELDYNVNAKYFYKKRTLRIKEEIDKILKGLGYIDDVRGWNFCTIMLEIWKKIIWNYGRSFQF